MKIEPQQLIRQIQDRLLAVSGVFSVTITGSFAESGDFGQVSDIDTVVICEQLDRAVWADCQQAAQSIDLVGVGLSGWSLRVNSTFGPMKHDVEQTAVIHLMVYDRAGHRRHVLQSPFTCLDWERSDQCAGTPLAQIYPVLALQPGHFRNARRGMQDYLQDLAQGVISYRRYVFDGDQVGERRETQPLDARHQSEYAYHIMRYLLTNARKLLRHENRIYTCEELVETLVDICGHDTEAHAVLFRQLWQAKVKGQFRLLAQVGEVIPAVQVFLRVFDEKWDEYWDAARVLTFVRHAATPLNDGSFLGQGRDPDVLPFDPGDWPARKFDKLYASPLRRTVQTAQQLQPQMAVIQDDRLREINYGRAEGLWRNSLADAYPEIVAGWLSGQDPRFPEGENTADVLDRLRAFMAEHRDAAESDLLVTHNVVLRCLVGMLYAIPMPDWYKIQIPHLAGLEVLTKNEAAYANLSEEVKAAITDSLVGYK